MVLNLPLNEIEEILCPVINIITTPAELPESLCEPCDIPEQTKLTELTITEIEVCLRSFIYNQVHNKYCTKPPTGCV